MSPPWPRRGVLYSAPPAPPQLENTGPWKAAPILISGAEAYRAGEFLYQDFLFDDHGATGPADDPADPFNQIENMFAAKHGTLSYPTDTATFANNAADLVELRVKPLAGETALRVTVNTLKAADRTAFTVAIGGSGKMVAWPHGAGVASPAALFLTVHGSSAELLDGPAARRSALRRVPPSISLDARSMSASRTRRGIPVPQPSAWRPASACGIPRPRRISSRAPWPPPPRPVVRVPPARPCSTWPSAPTSRSRASTRRAR